MLLFLLTRPSRGATQYGAGVQASIKISTHTPLAGRDQATSRMTEDVLFHFYSHAPRGARLYRRYMVLYTPDFYSHAPRGARQGAFFVFIAIDYEFLLTRPSRGATGIPFSSV